VIIAGTALYTVVAADNINRLGLDTLSTGLITSSCSKGGAFIKLSNNLLPHSFREYWILLRRKSNSRTKRVLVIAL
jgi:hypothetical protein